MQHPYESLKAEYAQLIAAAKIRPECEHVLAVTARRLLHDKMIYQEIYAATGVPVAVLMALSEREMSGNLHCYLGNGQHLTMRTTIVPVGRGPFPDTPDGFVRGALDALRIDGLDKIAQTPEGWSLPRTAYEFELWNGFGYRARGIPSPYVFGATTVQRPGKFIRDHVYSATTMDPQLGALAIIEELFKLDPSLTFAPGIAKVENAPPLVPAPQPVGLGVGIIDMNDLDSVKTLETALNNSGVLAAPIAVNGSYDRETMAAVRTYQTAKGLDADGLAGPLTLAALGLEAA